MVSLSIIAIGPRRSHGLRVKIRGIIAMNRSMSHIVGKKVRRRTGRGDMLSTKDDQTESKVKAKPRTKPKSQKPRSQGKSQEAKNFCLAVSWIGCWCVNTVVVWLFLGLVVGV